jgi:hypothetical protein
MWEKLEKRDNLEDLGIIGKAMPPVKWILKKYEGNFGLVSSG